MLPGAMSSTGKFTTVFCKLALQPYSGTPLTRVLKQSGRVSPWEEGAPPGALGHSFGGMADGRATMPERAGAKGMAAGVGAALGSGAASPEPLGRCCARARKRGRTRARGAPLSL